MDHVPYSQIGKGTFLIASPEIEMGPYFRVVILLCEHSTSGSFGLILNKPLDIELPPDLLNLEASHNPKLEICAGGPIQPNQMMLLHSAEAHAEQALKICDGVYLGGDLQFLQEAAADPNGPYLKLCFGYAGWTGGMLEREFLNGDWFLSPAKASHVFEAQADKMWASILREMGGRYASLSMIPEDLSLN